ncbi:MAG: hypothetical protein ACE5HN_04145 [Nitrospiria bacterium]
MNERRLQQDKSKIKAKGSMLSQPFYIEDHRFVITASPRAFRYFNRWLKMRMDFPLADEGNDPMLVVRMNDLLERYLMTDPDR